jgi:site-specific DNA recombinase
LKSYFAYTRVSTQRQGEQGVSLQEQKAEIDRFARQKGLEISAWFEERQTAAKLGRPVFMAMLKRLRKKEAAGLIIHKIDRSARNLKDWVDIAQLSDEGIEIHFIREAVDMRSSSGRLAADVQAVVAANYIRNLREESIKGFYGRLKQGVLPRPAPVGYLNVGPGKPKTIDPEKGPLVREAFLLYASGRFSLHSLVRELYAMGLRSRKGARVTVNRLSELLSNPFYYGLILIRKGNQTFLGAHEPLISKKLFDQVQDVLEGRTPRRGSNRREFLFSRLIRCITCGRSLIAEVKKGHTYYRCHTRECPTTAFREELIEGRVAELLGQLKLHPREFSSLDKYVEKKRSHAAEEQQRQLAAINIRLVEAKSRLDRLTDAYVDGHIDAEAFHQRKETLLAERLGYEGKIHELQIDPTSALNRLEEYVGLVKTAYLQYENEDPTQKRRMLQMALSNRTANGKTLDITLKSELSRLSERPRVPSGGPPRGDCATEPDANAQFWERWVDEMSERARSEVDEKKTRT